MPYLGNTAGNRFVASKAATQFSGDGSTTAFTLDHAVGSDEDILVSVDGVIQEPSVAYAVSSGTTLTFTAAPSNNSGNNIFVYYLFRTVGTISHPATNALQATSGTFTGDVTVDTDTLKVDATNDSVGINTATPSGYYATDLVVGAGDNGGVTIANTNTTHAGGIFFADGTGTSAYRGQMVYDHNNDSFGIWTAANNAMMISSTGAMTKPLQPIAHTYFTSSSIDGAYNAGTSRNGIVIKPNASYINIGSMYDSSTGRYTVPIAGKYVAVMSGSQYNNGVNNYHMVHVRNNGNIQKTYYNSLQSGSSSWTHMDAFTIFSCSANDYIDFFNSCDGATSGSDKGGFDVNRYTAFAVYLLA